MNRHLIPLPQLPRALHSLTDAEGPPSYRLLYHAVLNGLIPAEQVNGRWYCRDEDLPAIAAKLGLTKATPRGNPRQRFGATMAAAS